MSEYWFTVAGGPNKKTCSRNAEKMVQRAAELGVTMHVLGGDTRTREAAQMWKIWGILQAPPGCSRIYYFDADTFPFDLMGHEHVNGSCPELQSMNLANVFTRRMRGAEAKQQLNGLTELLRKEGMGDYLKECPDAEWNGGVLMGDAVFMRELATEWLRWWKLIKEFNGGEWVRDQASYRFAYYRVAVKKYGLEGLPDSWNWIVKKKGFRPDINVMHMAGKPSGLTREYWDRVVSDVLGGKSPEEAMEVPAEKQHKRSTLVEIHNRLRLGNLSDKNTKHSYLPYYEKVFSKRRDKIFRVLEVGVKRGGSLLYWSEYFPQAVVVGIDVNMDGFYKIPGVDYSRILLREGDATDPLMYLGLLPFDLVIDDGSHAGADQIAVYESIRCMQGDVPWIHIVEDVLPRNTQKVVSAIPGSKEIDLVFERPKCKDNRLVIAFCNEGEQAT